MSIKPLIYIVLAGGVLALAACTTGQEYQRPALDLPAQYTAGPVLPDSSLAHYSWRAFFRDTALLELIDRALAHNFDLRIALTRIDIARALAAQAKAAWLPAWRAQLTGSTVFPSENSLNGISLENFLGRQHVEDYTLAAAMSWEIDIWGKIKRQKEAALAGYLQSAEAARAVQTAIVAGVADGYYNLLMLDAQLAIARRNLLLSDSLVQMMRIQKTAGEVTELAVQQAQALWQEAALLSPRLEQAVALQENALRQLLGDWPGAVSRPPGAARAVVDTAFATGVPAELLALRPDVRASEMALTAANARVGVAQASMYPSLTITASGGLNAFKASDWFSLPASLFGTAAGALTQPIFERRALKTQLEIARGEREQHVIAFRQSVTQAVHEVADALVRLDKLRQQHQIAGARVRTLDLAVRNARLLFRSGLASYLEVITAQSNALRAELEQAEVVRQQQGARVALYHALGGGWR